MARIALVGYEQIPSGGAEDIIKSLLPKIITSCRHEVVHTDIVESRRETSPIMLVRSMLLTHPDLIHYTNYRDQITRTNQDEAYLSEALKQSEIPILLTSASKKASELAERLGILFIDTNPQTLFNDYLSFLKKLS